MPDRKIVFAGTTAEDEKIVLYVEDPAETDFVLPGLLGPTNRVPVYRQEFFLKLPNGEVWALSPQGKIFVWENEGEPGGVTHVKIESPEWTGTAVGGREDLLRAESEQS